MNDYELDYKTAYENTLKGNKMLVKENQYLQSNWRYLRKYIIGLIEDAHEELNTIIHTTDTDTKDGLKYVNLCSGEFNIIVKNLEIVLDKMNELERGE